MELYLAKPDLIYFEQYNEMMAEWLADDTQISPWFLKQTFDTMEEFARYIQMLDDCENGILDKKFCSTSSYFLVDENDRLIGAASLRHHLTVAVLNSWGHIGYGIRPSERRKGYATRQLQMVLEEAKGKKLRKILIGAHETNIGSCRVIETCGGQFAGIVPDPDEPEKNIRQYWIKP